MHDITVSLEVPVVHAWQWDYPIEKNVQVMLLCGNAPARITQIIDSQFDVNYGGFTKNCAGRLIPMYKGNERFYLVIILSEWENTNNQIAILSHETNHLVFTHFKDRGHHIPSDPDRNDEENFCAHQEMWLNWFLNALNSPDKEQNIFTFSNEQRIDTGTSPSADCAEMRPDQGIVIGEEPKVWQQRAYPAGYFFERPDRPAANLSED